MKVVRNKVIPFKGFKAINICGVLFVRTSVHVSKEMLNHERIHTAQMKELIYVLFYMLYSIEWLLRMLWYRDFKKAYRNISFEKEAYANEHDETYLNARSRFAWMF